MKCFDMDLFKEFWDRTVSRKQNIERSFIDSMNGITTLEKVMPELCLIEMMDPETGEKKFLHNYKVDRAVYYDEEFHNYYILRRICREMLINEFGIETDDYTISCEKGNEIEKFFTDNFGLLEKFLDSVLEHTGFPSEYKIKGDFEFYVPDAFLYNKKTMWIASLMKHRFKFDSEKYEYLDEIEEKSYDEDGYFEYYSDEYDSGPTVLDDWANAFFLVMVSYYSIRKVKFCDVYPDFNEKEYMDGYIKMSGMLDVSVLDELIDRHIKSYDDINRMLDDYDRLLYGLCFNDLFDNIREIIKMIREEKPDVVEFKTMMKYQKDGVKMWVANCLIRTFED